MKNKQSAHTNMLQTVALVSLGFSGSWSRDKIGGFVVQGILRFTNPVLSFFRTSVRPPAFAGFTKITLLLTSQYGLLVLFLFRKSILREPNIKIHIGSNQFKPPSALPFYDYWKKNRKFIVRLTGSCRNG